MFCSKCNSEIPEGARFCISCGEPVKQKRFCTQCKSELLENTKFCVFCGARVEAAPAEPVKPVIQSMAAVAPMMSEVKEIAAVEPIKPAVQEMAAVEPIKPAVQEMAAVEPMKPAVQEIAVEPIKPAVREIAAVEPIMPAVQEMAVEPVKSDDDFDDLEFEVPVIAPVIDEDLSQSSNAFGSFDISSPFSLDKNDDNGKTVSIFDAAAPSPKEKEPVSVSKADYSEPVYSKPAENKSVPSFAGSGDLSLGGGYIPPYDPKKTLGNAQTPTVVSNAPAAAAVVKKSRKKPVIIAIAAVLAAVIAAGVIFYFTNTALFLSTFMGKSNYAAMVEGNSIKQAADMIDKGSVSTGVKTAAGLYASFGLLYPYGSGRTVLLSAGASTSTVDLSSFFAALNSSVRDTYGVNSVMISIGMDAELTDTGRNELKNRLGFSDEQMDDLIGYINSLKLSSGITAGEYSAAFKSEMEIKDLKVNIKLLINSNGEAYVVFPFASEKALMVKVGETSGFEISSSNEAATLELDESEIERFINEAAELYIECYRSSEIEMENGSLDVSGVSVSGKALTAEFDSEMLEKLIFDIAKKFAEDSYFKSKITSYLNKCGIEISESDYEKAVINAASAVRFDTSATLKVTTVINNRGTVLAKSYRLFTNDGEASFSYVDNGDELSYELKSGVSGEPAVLSVKIVKDSETSGKAVVKISGEDINISLEIDYRDAKIEKFCGKDTIVGTYEISVSMPKNFEDENSIPANLTILSDSTLVFRSTVSSDTHMTSIGIISGKYGNLTFDCSLTAQNNTTDLSEPSSVIDLTSDNGDEIDGKELVKFLEDIRDAIDAQNAGDVGDLTSSIIDSIISTADSVSEEQINELSSLILSNRNEVIGFSGKYNIHSQPLNNEASALYQKYEALYSDLVNTYYENFSLTNEEYTNLKGRLDALEKEKNALDEKYRAMAGLPLFSSVNADEIMSVLGEYKDKLNNISNNEASMARIEADSALKSKYDECTQSYNAAFEKALEAYKEYAKNGEVNDELLNSARVLLKNFVNAYENLESSL